MPLPKKSQKRIADRGVKAKDKSLHNKRLALALTGGIASTEGVKIIREFRRRGAQVYPYMTKDAELFITPLSIEWASENKLVSQSSARAEHLDDYDAVIVAPATLNTINKAALGIADNPVSLLIASQLGNRTPLFLVPTMNLSLKQHPRYAESKKILEDWGAVFFPETVEEDRLKMPDAIALVDWVIKEMK